MGVIFGVEVSGRAGHSEASESQLREGDRAWGGSEERKPRAEVHERHFGPEYLRTHGLSTPQARAWCAIVACRTPALGGKRTIGLPGPEFVGRLLQHVLPPGFKRIRHYGLLAPAGKTKRLALARQLLTMPVPNPQAREDAQAFMRRVAALEIDCCVHCKTGRWQVVQELPANRLALSLLSPTACRGPP